MRTANRLGTLLLGLALIAVGLLVAIETALVAAGRDPWLLPLDSWHHRLTTTTAASGTFLAVSIAVAAVGLILLVAEVRPWPPQLVAVAAGRPGESWWVARRSVEQRVSTAANRVTGVHDANARVRGGRSAWRVRLSARGDSSDRDRVSTAVRDELGGLGAPSDVRVKVSLRRGRVA
jgi:hypothetical protein